MTSNSQAYFDFHRDITCILLVISVSLMNKKNKLNKIKILKDSKE